MEKFVVIVAGGSGIRMNSKLPKQFIELGSLPILMHTINCFRRFAETIQIILVLPKIQIVTWEALCKKHNFSTQYLTIVEGGSTRFQSCRNGIMAINDENALVAIHDGVRPFVSNTVIKNGYDLAKKMGTAVCCVASKDSIRLITSNGIGNSQLERKNIRIVQTPQTFSIKILKKAYIVQESDIFTDDASVVEHNGNAINLYEGDYRNIKITTAEDLELAKILLKQVW